MLKILYMNFHTILTESEVVYNTHFTKKGRQEGRKRSESKEFVQGHS